MKLQEVIQVLKTGDPFEDAAKFEEALETVISAYEITDEDIDFWRIKNGYFNDDVIVVDGAKAFRDGKISKP